MTAISVPADGTLNWAPPLRQAILDINAGKLDTTALDATLAPVLTNPASAARTALNATYALSRTRTTLAIIGDSIAYNGGRNQDDPLTSGSNFAAWANIILGHPYDLLVGRGDPGAAISGIDFPPRLTAMLATGASVVVVEFGSNDVASGNSLAVIQAAYVSAAASIVGAGRRVVFTTAPPRIDYTPTQRIVWGQLNAWLRAWAPTQPGVAAADTAAYLCDPANAIAGRYIAAYDSGDGIHPNVAGALQMGYAIAVALQLWPTSAFAPPLPSDPSNLLPYGASSWAGGGAGRPTGYFGADTGSVVYSQLARTDGRPGVWQQVAIANGAKTSLTATAAGYAPGDVLRMFVEMLTSGLDPAPAGEQRVNVVLTAYAMPSYAVLAYTADLNAWDPAKKFASPASGMYVSPPFVVPVGTGELDLGLTLIGGGTYRLGRIGVLRLTP